MKLFRGVTFSLNRFLGITQAKQWFSRKTGVPTTKNGMLRKIGAMVVLLFIPKRNSKKKK